MDATNVQIILEPWISFLSDDPVLRLLQIGMLSTGILVIFLVFYTTRDILLRTNSFLYMFFSIILVAAFPVAGFCIYLLIRPSQTLKQKELHALMKEIAASTKKKTVAKTATKTVEKKSKTTKAKKKK